MQLSLILILAFWFARVSEWVSECEWMWAHSFAKVICSTAFTCIHTFRQHVSTERERALHCVGHCVYALCAAHAFTFPFILQLSGPSKCHSNLTCALPLTISARNPLPLSPLCHCFFLCRPLLALLSSPVLSCPGSGRTSSEAKGHRSYQCCGMCKWQVPRPITSSIRPPPERCPKAIQSFFSFSFHFCSKQIWNTLLAASAKGYTYVYILYTLLYIYMYWEVVSASLMACRRLRGGACLRVPVQTAANKSFDIYKPSQSYAKALLKFV